MQLRCVHCGTASDLFWVPNCSVDVCAVDETGELTGKTMDGTFQLDFSEANCGRCDGDKVVELDDIANVIRVARELLNTLAVRPELAVSPPLLRDIRGMSEILEEVCPTSVTVEWLQRREQVARMTPPTGDSDSDLVLRDLIREARGKVGDSDGK